MNPKKIPSVSAAILFAAVSPLVAQDSASSSGEAVQGGSSSSSLLVPSLATEEGVTGNAAATVTGNTGEESSDVGLSSFFFPGGYGYLPETVSGRALSIGRSPVIFSLAVTQGYDDNIYSSSGREGYVPKVGSWTTQLSGAADVLFATGRTYLATQLSVGGIYYWDKHTDSVSPVGNLNLAFSHNFTPRLHFVARINGGYYNQPDFSIPNAPSRPNSGDYFNLNSLFDLGYQWTPLFATNTTLGVNTQIFKEKESQYGNYVEFLVGESFRYKFAPRLTGVLDFRFSKIWYDDSRLDSTTEWVLVGADAQINPRLNGSLRVGASFRQFEQEGADDSTSPYVEAVLGYRYAKGSLLQWSNRYGFEESGFYDNRYKTFRTGLLVNHAVTARINFLLGVSYAHQDIKTLSTGADSEQHLIAVNAGLQYVLNRHFAVSLNYNRNEVVADWQGGSYDRNRYSLTLNYQF